MSYKDAKEMLLEAQAQAHGQAQAFTEPKLESKPEYDPHGNKPAPTPIPKCPRCGRSVLGKLIHLVSPDRILHTFLCAEPNCNAIISLQIDFMTMHASMMEQMQAAGGQGQGQEPLIQVPGMSGMSGRGGHFHGQ